MSATYHCEVSANRVVALGEPDEFTLSVRVEQDAKLTGLILHVPCMGFMTVKSIRLRHHEAMIQEEDAFLFSPLCPAVETFMLPIATPPDYFEVRMAYGGRRPEGYEDFNYFSVLARFCLTVMRPVLPVTRRVQPRYCFPDCCPICLLRNRAAEEAGKKRWGRVFKCVYCGVDWKFPRYRRPDRGVGGHPRRVRTNWKSTYGWPIYSGRLEWAQEAGVRHYDINSAYPAEVKP